MAVHPADNWPRKRRPPQVFSYRRYLFSGLIFNATLIQGRVLLFSYYVIHRMACQKKGRRRRRRGKHVSVCCTQQKGVARRVRSRIEPMGAVWWFVANRFLMAWKAKENCRQNKSEFKRSTDQSNIRHWRHASFPIIPSDSNPFQRFQNPYEWFQSWERRIGSVDIKKKLYSTKSFYCNFLKFKRKND